MPEFSALLACACPVARYIDHVIHWRVPFSFVLFFFQPMRFFLPFSSPFLSLNFFFVVIVAVFFFSPLVLRSVTAACSSPFVWGLMAGLRCCAGHGGIISF